MAKAKDTEENVTESSANDPRTVVWQVVDDTVFPPTLTTLMKDKREVNGTTFNPVHIMIKANPSRQYVLRETDVMWDEQYAAMCRHAKKYGLVKLDSSKEGQVPEKYQPKLTKEDKTAELERLLAAERAKTANLLEALDAKAKA